MTEYNEYVTAINKIFYCLSKMQVGLNSQDNMNYIEAINEFKQKVVSYAEVFKTPYTAPTPPSEVLGNGIANQFTLKITTNFRILREEINPGFGYVIKKGKAVLIKLMSDE